MNKGRCIGKERSGRYANGQFIDFQQTRKYRQSYRAHGKCGVMFSSEGYLKDAYRVRRGNGYARRFIIVRCTLVRFGRTILEDNVPDGPYRRLQRCKHQIE